MKSYERRNKIADDAKDAGPPVFGGGLRCINCPHCEFEHSETGRCSIYKCTCQKYQSPIKISGADRQEGV